MIWVVFSSKIELVNTKGPLYKKDPKRSLFVPGSRLELPTSGL